MSSSRDESVLSRSDNVPFQLDALVECRVLDGGGFERLSWESLADGAEPRRETSKH